MEAVHKFCTARILQHRMQRIIQHTLSQSDVLETDERIEPVFGTEATFGLSYTLSCKGIRVFPKLRVFPSGTFSIQVLGGRL